eukprot:TRINITY_DN757_c0_g1_i4.p1 TRINITY_DN757_c0_g1~~TRINITY_DN757_c0_g1_i4.p1  ORF type:complete len:403 (+),score=46.99 TRINITY_DN757_c0_g1_i4:108-1316(+)
MLKFSPRIGVRWFHGGDYGDEDPVLDKWIARSHRGPFLAYMAKSDTGQGNVWFKIHQSGKIQESTDGQWTSVKWSSPDEMLANDGVHYFNIPADITPGNYLVRAEIIALHDNSLGGAQPYVRCAELTVTGGGSSNPAGVSLPGAYTRNDPGFRYSVYDNFRNAYPFPGPAVYQAAAAPVTTNVQPPVTTRAVTTNAQPPVTTKAQAPATTSPVTTNPLTTKPLTTKALTTTPMTTKELTTKPLTTKALTTTPMTTKELTTKPLTTKALTTKPSADLTTSQDNTYDNQGVDNKALLTTKALTTKPLTTKPLTTKPLTTSQLTTRSVETTAAITSGQITTGVYVDCPLGVCPENSSCVDGACLCDEGFMVNEDGTGCEESSDEMSSSSLVLLSILTFTAIVAIM